MGSPNTTRNSYRLRTSHRHRNPQELSSETTPRTTRPRTRPRNTTTPSHRHRHHGYRVALLILIGLLGQIMTAQPAQAASKRDCPQHHAILKKYGLPPKIFGPIAYRESRCSFTSISAIRKSTGRPDVGLLQVQASWSTVTQQICKVKRSQVIRALTRPDCHLRVAAYLWADGKGASNWSIRSGHNG